MTRLTTADRRRCVRLAAIPVHIREETFAACMAMGIPVTEQILFGAARLKRMTPTFYVFGEAMKRGVSEVLFKPDGEVPL